MIQSCNSRPFVRSSIRLTRDGTTGHETTTTTTSPFLRHHQPPILNRSLTAVSFRPKSKKRERTDISLKSSAANGTETQTPYTTSYFRVDNLSITYEIKTIHPIKSNTSTTTAPSRNARKSVHIEPVRPPTLPPTDIASQRMIEQRQHQSQMQSIAKDKFAKYQQNQQFMSSKSFINNLKEKTIAKKQTTFMTDFEEDHYPIFSAAKTNNRSAFNRSQAYVPESARTDPHKRSILKKREAINRKYSNLTEMFKNDSLESYSSDSLRLTPVQKRLMSTHSTKYSDDSNSKVVFSNKSKTDGYKSNSYVNPQNSFFESLSRLSDVSSYDSDMPKPDLWAVDFDDD